MLEPRQNFDNSKQNTTKYPLAKPLTILFGTYSIFGLLLVIVTPTDVMTCHWAQNFVACMLNIAPNIASYNDVDPHGSRQFIAAASLLFVIIALLPTTLIVVKNKEWIAVNLFLTTTKREFKKKLFIIPGGCAFLYLFTHVSYKVGGGGAARGAIFFLTNIGTVLLTAFILGVILGMIIITVQLFYGFFVQNKAWKRE